MRYRTLDTMRGCAVIAVLLQHSLGVQHPDTAWAWLYPAVPVFLVESGWLSCRSLSRTTPGRYLRRRALRIYPAYLLFIATVAIGFGAPLDPLWGGDLVARLAGRTAHPFVGHLWSIQLELAMYALAPLLWVRPRAALVGAVALTALKHQVEGAWLLLAQADAWLWGVVLYRWQATFAAARAELGLTSAAVWGFGYVFGDPAAACTGGMLLALAWCSRPDSGPTWRPLEWCGQRCLSIYLWQTPLLGVAALCSAAVGLPLWLAWVWGGAVTLALAGASWVAMERPLLARSA